MNALLSSRTLLASALVAGLSTLSSLAEVITPVGELPAAEECQLSMRTPTEVTWRGPHSRGYAADQGGIHGERVSFEIRSAGGYCGYYVEITPVDGAYVLNGPGAALPFVLSSADGVSSSNLGSPVVIGGSSYPQAGGRFVNFLVEIEPNRNVQAGRYSQDLNLVLYSETDGAPVFADTRQMRVVADVWPRVSAAIGPNAFSRNQQAQINLGRLQAGKETPLDFSVDANTTYEVKVRSENAGSLKHSRSDATLPYELILDGTLIDPSTLGSDTVVSTGSTSKSHDFRLRISRDTKDIPAGFYNDRLMVTVTAG